MYPTKYTFSYDGAPDSKNNCPRCHKSMHWQDIRPLDAPRWMICENCRMHCNIDTEQVFQVGVPMERWAKDHWSILAYIETCAVDHYGELDKRRMRANPDTHPMHYVNTGCIWMPLYGTRLKNPIETLSEHDDWDCIEDMEDYGLVELISSINGFIRLTDKGRKIVNKLREHKAAGKNYSEFTYQCE